MLHAPASTELTPWLERLRALPPVRAARQTPSPPGAAAALQLKLTTGERRYLVAIHHSAKLATHVLAQLDLQRLAFPKEKWLLLAPYISSGMGHHLQEAQVDYLDAAGNCHLTPLPAVFIHIEGRKPQPAEVIDGRTNLRGGGLHVLFVLAAKPELAKASVRELAEQAGAGKSTTAETLARLTAEGLLAESRGQRQVLRPQLLLDRWVHAYAQTLRPKWILGRFRSAATTPEALEAQLEPALAGTTWAWGGTAAVMRLTHYYRGPETIVHVDKLPAGLPQRLRALPDRNGPLILMQTPMPLAFHSPIEHVAHPLLVYSELVVSTDERAQRAAQEVRERFLDQQP